MAEVTLTVIVPTISRPSLARTLKSLVPQAWVEGDEVIVLADGKQEQAKSLVVQLPSRCQYVEYTAGPCGDWSHTPRNWLMRSGRIHTTHFAILDDDDVYTADAVEAMRQRVSQSPTLPHIFRMDDRHHNLGVLWKDPEIRAANVGTPMIVVPNVKEKLGRFTLTYTGDYEFIKETCGLFDGAVWEEHITTIVRPPL